jgi:hypothetical protein
MVSKNTVFKIRSLTEISLKRVLTFFDHYGSLRSYAEKEGALKPLSLN